ncbi:MAG: transposase [Planctomycetes bacterium]|nr:transposase [Planctomycetota bacterium]
MGDRRRQALGVQFDGKIKLRCHGAKITSDAGLLAFGELDEAFRLTERGSTVLADPRQEKNTRIDHTPRRVT